MSSPAKATFKVWTPTASEVPSETVALPPASTPVPSTVAPSDTVTVPVVTPVAVIVAVPADPTVKAGAVPETVVATFVTVTSNVLVDPLWVSSPRYVTVRVCVPGRKSLPSDTVALPFEPRVAVPKVKPSALTLTSPVASAGVTVTVAVPSVPATKGSEVAETLVSALSVESSPAYSAATEAADSA